MITKFREDKEETAEFILLIIFSIISLLAITGFIAAKFLLA